MVHSFTLVGDTTKAVALATARKPFVWANVQSLKNTGAVDVRLVARASDGTFPSTGGVVLTPGSGEPGASFLIPWMGAPLPYDFSALAIIITHAGDGVDVIYGS